MLNEILEDQIIIIQLNNGNTNSITMDTLQHIDEIVNKANQDDHIKGLIFTGTGKFMSSGFDLPMFLKFKDHAEVIEWFIKEEAILMNYFGCQKPVIAAINGHAAAAGLIFSMASDYRIVKNHPKIKIGMSENKIGLPLSIAQAEVVRFGLNSDHLYRDVMFFGDMVNVDKAKMMGIVDEIVEEDQLIQRAKQIIVSWIDNPGRPFIPMKRQLKYHTLQKIQLGLQQDQWKEELKRFFDPNVRATLEFVQAAMDSKA